ncbi:aryl-alcohol dehydrogenase-like predicted oxidoreductase [Sinorhizobium meliloti]|nr:aryl-alcohol dehydrogenase-like predicted oxidoreductase [Sinorhizobium meliloti]GEC36508.1 hypothetical protein EME01_05800 [Sinorhizobium meliloti]
MKTRILGRTGATISEIGFGAWQIGGSWGDVSEEDGKRALNAALDSGITFIDTADVYGDGRSEKIIAAVLQERGGEKPFVATKAGRRLNPPWRRAIRAPISRPSSTAASQISASKRLISSNSTAHRRRSTTGPRSSARSTGW